MCAATCEGCPTARFTNVSGVAALASFFQIPRWLLAAGICMSEVAVPGPKTVTYKKGASAESPGARAACGLAACNVTIVSRICAAATTGAAAMGVGAFKAGVKPYT